MIRALLVVFFATLFCRPIIYPCVAADELHPWLGPVFNYQGELSDGNKPANGHYEMVFRLADAPMHGNFAGQAVTNTRVSIHNGVFQVPLRFGLDAFGETPRWLEILVRTNGSEAPFAILTPRQHFTWMPYSAYSEKSRTADHAFNLAEGGVGLTNIRASALMGMVPLRSLSGITSAQMDPATDALYRAGHSNRISVLNVQDFGAKGDGVTDDTLAISNAWEVFARSGGTLFFPPGTYLDSCSHAIKSRPSTPGTIFRDGRLILGMGGVRWVYTGQTRLLYCTESTPDIDGIEFVGNSEATNCIYISHVFGKASIRNCFFNFWPNATHGALVLDEADSVSLLNNYAYNCRVGFGFGFRCNNLKADIETYACEIGVAIGVPTQNSPVRRESYNIDLNLMSLYCSNGVAMDAGAVSTTIRGYFWNTANSCVMIGMIPGISTNYGPLVTSVTLNHSYFQGSDRFGSPIQLYSGMYRSLDVISCRFDQTRNSAPLIKSHTTSGDQVPVNWTSNHRNGSRPQFEDSAGRQFAEMNAFQNQALNRTVGVYNWRSQSGQGGSGYCLDVMDASRTGPVARIGISGEPNSPSFSSFLGGLVVGYDPAAGKPEVSLPNANLVLSAPGTVESPNAPGKQGMIRWDANYVYVCIAPNQWKRTPLTSW